MTTAPDFRELCAELLSALETEGYAHWAIDPDEDPLCNRARAALATPLGPPKNCWLDDEDDLCPSPCVFDDPSEVISNCIFAETVKCKTDCKYYRVVAPSPEPPTDDELSDLWTIYDGIVDLRDFVVVARAVLERWGRA
jgi:hypothetical protein